MKAPRWGAQMHEPPAGLDPEALRRALELAYGLAVEELRFLPLGYDSFAWVYRVRAREGGPYFLKLRASMTNEAALRVPHLLHARGVSAVVAPIATRTGALWATHAGFALILYPFVAGESGMEAGLAEGQWVGYGETLRQIHATPVPPELASLMRRERYRPEGADLVRKAEAAIAGPLPVDPEARALAEHWRLHGATISLLLERAEGLGRALRTVGLPEVLCHGDIHTGNVLRDGETQLWVVDWDETVLAPKERDLMFAIGGISARLVGPREEALFEQGYGPTTIDAGALAYYRYAWAVSDIASYSDQLLFRPELGQVSRAAALSILIGLFAPGEIVAIALGSPLPPGIA